MTQTIASRTADVLVIEWGNGNTDVFADADDLAACYNDPSDETCQNARDLAEPRAIEAGEEIDTNSEEWSTAALAAVTA